MERDFAGARLTPESFQRLADTCNADRRFPTRYDDWQALVREGTAQARADGRPVDEFVIDPDEFLAWCRKVAIHPCFDALRAYLIIARRGTQLVHAQLRVRESGKPVADRPQGKRDGRAERTGMLARVLHRWMQRLTPRMRLRPAGA